MSVVEPTPDQAARTIVDRAKNLILQPSQEWAVIDGESPSTQNLFTGYVLPLALIPAIAGLIGGLVFGYGGFGVTIRPGVTSLAIGAVTGFAFSVLGVFILSFLIDALAPTFKAQKNSMKAMQVAVYSGTAGWLAGIFMIFPPLGVLGLLGLISLYTLFKGLPKLMKAPEDQALPYTAAVVVCAIVISIIAMTIVGAVTAPFRFSGAASSDRVVEGTITMPGGGTIDLGQLDEAAKEMERSAAQMEAAANGAAVADSAASIPLDRLEAALPAALPGGLVRGSVETVNTGAMGMNTAMATATYANGDRSIELQVADMGAMGGFAAIAAAAGVQATTNTADGFERVRTENGVTVTESYSRSAGSSEVTLITTDRILVSAKGQNVDFETTKAAANAINASALAAQRLK